VRGWIARAFTLVEDVVYVGLGLLLAGSAIALLVGSPISLAGSVATPSFASTVMGLRSEPVSTPSRRSTAGGQPRRPFRFGAGPRTPGLV